MIHETTVEYLSLARAFLCYCTCGWTQIVGRNTEYNTKIEADAKRVAADHCKEHETK